MREIITKYVSRYYKFVSIFLVETTLLTVASRNHFSNDDVPLFLEVVAVMHLHVLLEVADVGVARVADGTNVVRVLAEFRKRQTRGQH